MKRKILAGIVSGILVIAGTAFVFNAKIQHTSPDSVIVPPSSSVVQINESNSTSASSSTETSSKVNSLTEDEALKVANQGGNGQGEGEDLAHEIDRPEAESQEPTVDEQEKKELKPGDTVVLADGSVAVVMDPEEEDRETQRLLDEMTPEELKELQDMNLHFS